MRDSKGRWSIAARRRRQMRQRDQSAAVNGPLRLETGAPEDAQDHPLLVLAQLRGAWWYGLGGLWIVDALLQAQPSMFTAALVSNVLEPAQFGQPGWIATPIGWCIQLWQGHPALVNGGVVGLELLIGVLLLAGGRRHWWGRVGLLLSLVWGLMAWYLGQGLGGLFTGSASYLAGAPGSAILYVLLTIALLLPDTVWSSGRLLRIFTASLGLLWLVGAALQMAPLYWTPLGLTSLVQSVALMPLPLGLSELDFRLVASMATAPVLWNAILCALMAGLGVALLLGRGGHRLALLALIWLVVLWLPFQGFRHGLQWDEHGSQYAAAVGAAAGAGVACGQRARGAISPPERSSSSVGEPTAVRHHGNVRQPFGRARGRAPAVGVRLQTTHQGRYRWRRVRSNQMFERRAPPSDGLQGRRPAIPWQGAPAAGAGLRLARSRNLLSVAFLHLFCRTILN